MVRYGMVWLTLPYSSHMVVPEHTSIDAQGGRIPRFGGQIIGQNTAQNDQDGRFGF